MPSSSKSVQPYLYLDHAARPLCCLTKTFVSALLPYLETQRAKIKKKSVQSRLRYCTHLNMEGHCQTRSHFLGKDVVKDLINTYDNWWQGLVGDCALIHALEQARLLATTMCPNCKRHTKLWIRLIAQAYFTPAQYM